MQTEQQFIDGAFKAGLNPQQVSQAVQVYRQKSKPTTMDKVGNFAKSIAQPFVNTGKNIAGAGYELYRAGRSALGDKSAYVNQMTGEVKQNPFLNEQELAKVSQPLSLKKGSALRQQIGDSANIASYAVPFGKGSGIFQKAIIPGAAVGGLTSMTSEADLGDVAKGAAGGALFSAGTYGAGKLFKKIPAALNKRSEEVVTAGIGNPAKQAELQRRSGTTTGSFLKKYNILDRSPETAQEAKNAILKEYDRLALKSGKKVAVKNITSAIDTEIAKLQSGAGRFSDANKSKIEELLRRKAQFLEYAGGENASKVGVKEATLFRRESLDPDIPKSMFNLDAKGSGTAQGAKQMRDILRESINSSDPRLKQLGLDYGMAKGIEKILTQAQNRSKNRQLFNFTKLGTAGVGGLVAGFPGAIIGFVGERLVNHPVFIRELSNALQSGATGQEAINKVLGNTEVQQVLYQLAARGGSAALTYEKTANQSNRLPSQEQDKVKVQSYAPIVAPPVYQPKTEQLQATRGIFSPYSKKKLR